MSSHLNFTGQLYFHERHKTLKYILIFFKLPLQNVILSD